MSIVVDRAIAESVNSILIESVVPEVDEGTNPVKRIVGETLVVEADFLQDGHGDIAGLLKWRELSPEPTEWIETPFHPIGNDRFRASVTFDKVGRYAFTIEAWADQFSTWVGELRRKLEVRKDLDAELAEGARILKSAAQKAATSGSKLSGEKDSESELKLTLDAGKDAARLLAAEALLSKGPSEEAFALARDASMIELARRHSDRSERSTYREVEVLVERRRAQVGTWYEFFPRSKAKATGQHGTFEDAEALLPELAEMGFDVVYLPPIHPIGRTARKGKNNSILALPDEPGSPWAIGSAEGGHKSIHPQLGKLEDFKRFLAAASRLGLEVALDLAYQCSPDHPYVKEHPTWFHRWPDGTLKTAENPPKRYEDIVHFDFHGADRKALWDELKSIVLYWCDVGVRIFRVDNPHTKPLPFWRWLLRDVRAAYPDAIFLSEAFTRPKMMKALAKQGFSQSYTYFTWRNSKQELEQYMSELTQGPAADFMRGNLWANTPDILPQLLQLGGPAAFRLRYALAATLSPSCGIYRGYEYCEARALPGKEEYANSEKYQLPPLAGAIPYDIRDYLTRLNSIRREHPALQAYRNLRFYRCDNDRVLYYGKSHGADHLLIAVSLDPFAPQQTHLEIPHAELGSSPAVPLEAVELVSGAPSLWQGATAQVQLTPEAPAAIWRIRHLAHTEATFEYYY